MKKLVIALLVISIALVSSAAAQNLDWQAVQRIQHLSRISVKTQSLRIHCRFEEATSDQLFCKPLSDNPPEIPESDLVFNRSEIRDVNIIQDYDYSKGFLDFLAAAGGGGALGSTYQPDWFAGVKIGGPFSLDLQYDCLQGHSGFSTEGSAVIPMFRFPRFKADEYRHFMKVYAEPGLGYRAGGGPFGGYASAKVLVLLTDRWDNGTPYLEFQRRFPFDSPLQGDNRISIGIMIALCEHCGFD